MFKNKILFLLIVSIIFFWGTPVKAQTCTNGAETGACQASPCETSAGQSEVSSPSPACPTTASICCSGGGGGIPSPSPTGGLDYPLLEKIPGGPASGSDLPAYVLALYNLALAIVVLSAVFMVSIGGFMYLTSAGNTSAMGTAKGVIFDALIGLVIALTAWLLLNVINPDLTNVSINGLTPIAVPGGGVPITPPSVVAPGATWPSDASERAAILPITVNAANCATKGQTGCTSLAGSAAINALKALYAACGNCSMVVTGGTECWLHGTPGLCNSHHNQGDYAIDLRHGAIDSYIVSNGTKICMLPKGGVPRPVYRIGNAIFWDEDSAHWHANFNNSTCKSI